MPFALAIRSLRPLPLLVVVAAALAWPAWASAALTLGPLQLDANFHTIGVRARFTTPDGAAGNGALVEYRRPGEASWRTAPPAWLDVRPTLAYAHGAANWARDEARTKIFGLTPGVAYEVRVTFSGSVTGATSVTAAVTTRPLAPPEPALRTLYVDGANGDDGNDGTSAATPKRTVAAAFALATAGDRVWIAPGVYPQATRVTLAASGTDTQWIRVTRWPGLPGDVVLEGTGGNDSVLVLAGSYVRVDGLTIRRALGSCLRIEGGTTDHWIDDDVITDWNVDDDAGVQHEGAIAAWSNAARLVVMNSLLKRRDQLPGPQHGGGNGVWVKNQISSGTGGGHHVVRGNTIIGGWDGVGSDVEADPVGGFYTDTDVYENVVSDQQDDGIQMEGADVNCAVFGNVVRRGRTGIAFAPTGIGPLFVLRNRLVSPTWLANGPLYKVGAASDGRAWVFHESGYDGGVGDGTQQTNPGLANVVTRNNAWQVGRYVVETTAATSGPVPDLDYDALFTTDASGRFVKWFGSLRASLAAFQSADGQEAHGIVRQLAVLDWTGAAHGGLALRADSVLRDAALAIPGIDTDLEDSAWNFTGAAPDLGAIEARDADTTPPAVAIADPTPETIVGGTRVVTATASADAVQIAFFVDGTIAGTAASPPYELAWTTTALGDGAHLLAATATDAAGNVARSADVRVLVDNGHGGARSAELCAKAKLVGAHFERRTVDLVDPFGTAPVVVVRPTEACNPAFQGSGAIVDAGAYLTCYAIKGTSGAPRFVPRAVALGDAFGEQRWEIRRPVALCLPTSRDGSPVDPGRDAFACYQAKPASGTPRFTARAVAATDENGTTAIVAQKPSTFCVPARVDGAAASDPAARLACYRSKLAPGSPRAMARTVSATDAFGSAALSAVKPATWCQPAVE